VAWIVLLLLITILLAPAEARQTGAVSGTITNSLSGDLVSNVMVILESPGFPRQVRPGKDGKFTVPEVPAGVYHLVVRADGYLPSRAEVTVQSTGLTSDVRLNPE